MKWFFILLIGLAATAAAQTYTDPSIDFFKTECEEGDRDWNAGKEVLANVSWDICLDGLEGRVRQLKPQSTAAKEWRAWIDAKRTAIDKLRADRETERKAAREREEQERQARWINLRLREGKDRALMESRRPAVSRSGALPAVQKVLNEILHNPGSLRIVGWSRPVLIQDIRDYSSDEFHPWFWAVRVRYRARNAFNALILTYTDFYLRGNKVVYWENER